MSQVFSVDEIYGSGRGPAFQTRSARGATQDPFGGAMPAQAPTQAPMQAPPGGRDLPAGYVIPDPPHAQQVAQQSPQPSQPRPPRPSAGAREAATEQASARAAAQAEAAHQEAMQALKAAGEAKAAQQAAKTASASPSASHSVSQAAAQVAAHAAAKQNPQQMPPHAPQNGPRLVPPMDPRNNPAVAPVANPAGQVAGIPIDQVYAQYCNPLNPLDPNCVSHPVGAYPPSGVYNPMAANPSLSGNLSARTMTGSVGVGQITGQVPAGTPYGVVGGVYSGVSQPGVYGPVFGAGQAVQPHSSGASPEEAWLIAVGTNADGWLDMTPQQRANCLANAGCRRDLIQRVIASMNLFAARKTGRMQQNASIQPSFGMQTMPMGIQQMRPAGQAASSTDYTTPAVLILGLAAVGTYLYMTGEKREKQTSRKRSHRASSHRLASPRRGFTYTP